MADERNLLEDKIIKGAALWFFRRESSYRGKLLVIDFDRALAALTFSDPEGNVSIEKVSKGGEVSFLPDLEKLLQGRHIDQAEMTENVWRDINRRMERFHRFPERQKDLKAAEFSSGAVLRCSELDTLFENGSKESLSRTISEGVRMWQETGSDEIALRILPVGKTVNYQPSVFLIYHVLGSDPELEDPRIIMTENLNQDIPVLSEKQISKIREKESSVFDNDISLLLLNLTGEETPLFLVRKGMEVPEKGNELFSSPFYITESSKLTFLYDGKRRNALLSDPGISKEGALAQAAVGKAADGTIQVIIKCLPQDGSKEVRLTAKLKD